ncbi:EAL domain-containing protein [bacterium]|nr:EAL domain-containing protein [bacterium]
MKNIPQREIKSRIYDSQRQLPSYLNVLPEAVSFLKKDNALGLVYINGKALCTLEEKYGSTIFDDIMMKISNILMNMRGTVIRKGDIISLNRVKGYSFILFLGGTRKNNEDCNYLSKDDVEDTCERILSHLQNHLFLELYHFIGSLPKINVGYSFTVHNPIIDPWRAIYRLIEEARENAELQMSQVELKNRGRIQKVILEQNIHSVYQPIVNLKEKNTLGFEALSRGPQSTELEAPAILFSLAEETGMLYELDRVCRRRAIHFATDKKAQLKLFINTLPNLIHNPEFEAKQFLQFLDLYGISPKDIVFEITESHAIDQYSSFRQALKYYTNAGITLAIDDVGTGYSSLEAIMEIQPKYIKIDASLIRGAHTNPAKQEMLKALKTLAKSLNAFTIAEGIEIQEDLTLVEEMDIDFAQGYFFAKPAANFTEPSF